MRTPVSETPIGFWASFKGGVRGMEGWSEIKDGKRRGKWVTKSEGRRQETICPFGSRRGSW